jgi:hypothetical protein
MSLANIVIPPEPIKKGGGGLFGDLGGLFGGILSLAGLAAAPFTGGASTALTAAGATGTAASTANTVANATNAAVSGIEAANALESAVNLGHAAYNSTMGPALSAGSMIGKAVDTGQKIANATGTIGGIVDPRQPNSGGSARGGVDIVESAARQRLNQDPKALVAGLNESMDALKQSDRRLQSALNPFLEEARNKAMQRIGVA